MPTKEQILRLHDRLKTWRAVGKRLNVSPAVAWRYANEKGWEPKRKAIRERLGLGELILRKQVVKRNQATGRFEPIEQDQENES